MNKKNIAILLGVGLVSGTIIILTNKMIDKMALKQAKKNFTPEVEKQVLTLNK
jgi:hypothetical protein